MIPIEYRLDDIAEKEYIERVLECIKTPKLYNLKLIEFLDKIAIEKPEIKRSIMDQATRFSAQTLELDVLYAWIVMPYKDMEAIKKYIEKKIQDDLARINLSARNYYRQFTPLKSFHGLIERRRRYDYPKYPDVKAEIDKNTWYEQIYNNLKKFEEFYDDFSHVKINNWIVQKVGMKVCPYCNIAYTYSRGNSVTAQLDHFFPKSEYPMFALSFYNLIPSCSACNRIKHDDLMAYASPYEDGAFHNLRISWEYEGQAGDERYDEKESLEELEKKIKIKIMTPKLSEQNNISGMNILEAYQQHRDYAGEVIKKVKTYANPDAQKMIASICESEGLSSEEIMRFYFGNYINENELKKRPLSKMTKDFFEEYKKITRLPDNG